MTLCLLAVSPAQADELDHWIWRNPRPFNSQVNGLAQGNGLWMVFANAGMLSTSPDGVNWDLANISTNALLNAGAAGGGQFVLATSRGVYHSADAHNWARAVTSLSMNDVAFGNGLFAGVGGSSAWRSADGSAWASSPLGVVNSFDHIAFANGRFFALGSDSFGTNYLLYWSADATNWTGPVALGTNRLQRIAFGNGVYVGVNFVIAGTNAFSQVRTSTDGTVWSAPQLFAAHYLTDIAFANGSFVAVDEVGRALLTTNGVDWTEYAAPELFAAGRALWNGTLFVASGLTGNIVTSADGVHWTRRTLGPQNSMTSVLRTNGLYVAVTGKLVPGGGDAYSKSTVVTSTNGHDWTEHDSGTTNSLTALTCGNGQYAAVGDLGTIVSSPDASSWSAVVSPTTNVLYGVAYGGGRFVAVGGSGTRAAIVTSTDSTTWAVVDSATNYSPLYAITFAQNQFVAVGQTNAAKQAALLTSTDGLTWTSRLSGATNTLRGVTWGNSGFVAVGDRGALATSPDGLAWTNVSLNVVLNFRCVAWGNGTYLVPGYPTTLFTSTNATNWTSRPALSLVTMQALYAAVWGGDSFLLTGFSGQVLESVAFHPPQPQLTLTLRRAGSSFLSVTAPETHAFEVQSTDAFPPVWQPVGSATNLGTTTFLPDYSATNSNARFYRARLLD